MKTCEKCGALVEDGAQYCLECGASVIKIQSSLSLKANQEVKKKGNPMGTTISTGSGLTDILRAEDNGDLDESFYGGGPVTFTDPYANDDYVAKKKKDYSVPKTIFKLILLCAVVYLAYYVVTNVILNDKSNDSYEAAFEIYVECINEQDAAELTKLMAPYLNDRSALANELIADMEGVELKDCEITDAVQFDVNQEKALQQTITLSGKSFGVQKAYTLKVTFNGTVNGEARKIENVEMVFVKGDHEWYFDPTSYSNPVFTDNK